MTTLDRKISKKSSVDRIKLLVKTFSLKLHVTKQVTSNLFKSYDLSKLNSSSVYGWFYRLLQVVKVGYFAIIYVSLRKRDNENDQNKDHKKRWLLCRSING